MVACCKNNNAEHFPYNYIKVQCCTCTVVQMTGFGINRLVHIEILVSKTGTILPVA